MRSSWRWLGESSRKKPDWQAPNDPLIDLGQITQKSGKLVLGWAVEGDLDPSTAVSNTYEMEWPPHSGVVQTFPEIDRVEWFDLDEARRRLKPAQVPFLDRLQAALASTRNAILSARLLTARPAISRTVRPEDGQLDEIRPQPSR